MQADTSPQQEAQRQLVSLLEAEHRLLESVFPRHVLEHVALRKGMEGLGSVLPQLRDSRSLATHHPNVTVLFAGE